MGTQTIIHGRINLKGDFEKTRTFIKSLGDDDKYPWIRTEMFSIGSSERPYWYENPIIAFAADYKGLEYDFKSFVIKFEHILRNIGFDTAKIQMETEFYGTYNFFWKAKAANDRFEEEDQLVETDEWYFGYGCRGRWGYLDEDLRENQILGFGFEYPIKFDAEKLAHFNALLKVISCHQVVFLKEPLGVSGDLYPILTHYHVHKVIDYGSESMKGIWIKKLKEVEEHTLL